MTRSTAGFTLLEVLVAFAILSVAIVASIQGFAQGLRLLRTAGDHQQAILIADQKIREIVTPMEEQKSGTEGPFTWERTITVDPTPELTSVAATGSSPPRPRPAMIRAASSVSNVGASADSRLPIEKMTSVAVKTARRP